MFRYYTIGMEKERVAFDRFMVLLDQVVSRMGAAHTTAHDYGTGVMLYRAEIHTIQAIGLNPGINMSELARVMGVTKGAVSQTINKLNAKGLVSKNRIGADSREITLLLTDLGWKGYRQHESYHAGMYELARSYFGDRFKSKLKSYTAVMTELNEIMNLVDEHKLED